MARKIVITSGKGGVGKTTVTVNLGKALASLGLRVVMIDIDFGLNNLDVVAGVESKVLYDIKDIIDGRCRVKQALVQDNRNNNLYILSSGSVDTLASVNGQNVKLIIESLSSIFDYILIDCPAGIDVGFHRAVSCSDEAIIVTTPNLTSLRDADKVVSIIKSYMLKKIGVVVNRVRGDLIIDEKIMTPFEIKSLLKTELVGVLPEEDIVFLSAGYTLPNKSDSYRAYKILANNIHNESCKIFNTTHKYSGLFGSVRRSLKRNI